MKCERCGIEDAGVRTQWDPVFDGVNYVGDLRRWEHDDSDDCAECIAALQSALKEAEFRARREERSGTRDILEDAEDVLASYENKVWQKTVVGAKEYVSIVKEDFARALAAVRRARSMEDKDHE